MKKLLFYIIPLLLLFACEEETNWNLKNENTLDIVVEAILTSENMNHTVKLTKPILTINGTPETVSNAIVYLSDGENILEASEFPANSGIYYANQAFQALFNKTYYLYINYNNKVYRATDYMMPVTPLKNIALHNHSTYHDFYGISYVESDIASMIEIYLDWTHFNRFDTLYDGTGKAKMVYYTLNSIDVAEIFKPEKENIYFPEGTQIIRKKYSLSYHHQEFVRSMLSETEWRGGYFDVLPGNTITNLSEGALGYFGVCAVTSDTTYASDSYLK
jgi:Domain of unknown function (DUF4249)